MIANTFDDNGRLTYTCYYAPDWRCIITAGNLAVHLTVSIWIVPGSIEGDV